ncbi:MAG TPA: ribosome maturation factor RimM [Anaeromyxobacter sp.]
MKLVRLGKVVRAVGLHGHLGVAGTEGALAELGAVALRRGEGEPEVRRILEARPQGRLWAVKVEGVADRTAAEAWVGAEVLVEREALGEAGEGRYFWADLEGLPVVTAAGEAVGKVTGFYTTGAADVLVVTGERGEQLVPLAPYVGIDLEARRIVVDPPEGLLD